ncbi:MAG TPA: cupin-like domain-containing protein [Polyangiales bacterium]|nr:cupin-like domain-containing protein [Polyangiales bacterium]
MRALSEIAWPETADGFESIISRRAPVVFRRAAADWPCTQRWTSKYLRERLADKHVTATRGSSRRFRADPKQGHYAPADMQQMSFCEFLDRTCDPDPGPDAPSFYLHRQSLEQHLPELRDDVVMPRYLKGSSLLLVSLWMGPAGSVTPIHHDFTDNLFVQVQGKKRVILYEPDPDAAFYRLPFRAANGRSSWHISGVGSGDSADVETHPLFRQARGFEAVMDPGDILFIPNFYWHEVHSLDSPSISLSYWWDQRSLTETEAAIAKVTELVAFYDQQPAAWRSLIDGILRNR